MQIMTDEQAQRVIAGNLRKLRGKRSYSEIGRLAATSAGAIRDIEENGRMPGGGLLTRLADALSVKIDALFETKRKRKKSA
jgi:transcriptional regulator with XRE-family HTH domain